MPPLPLDPPAATEPPNQSRVCYPGVLARGGMSVGFCDGPPFASLSCLHQGAKKSTVLERLVLKTKGIWKGVDLNHLPTRDTPRRFCASAGAPAHVPLPIKDCGLPCVLQTVGIPI